VKTAVTIAGCARFVEGTLHLSGRDWASFRALANNSATFALIRLIRGHVYPWRPRHPRSSAYSLTASNVPCFDGRSTTSGENATSPAIKFAVSNFPCTPAFPRRGRLCRWEIPPVRKTSRSFLRLESTLPATARQDPKPSMLDPALGTCPSLPVKAQRMAHAIRKSDLDVPICR
jgi:hypothetical protein